MDLPIDIEPGELTRIGGKAAVLERLLQEDPDLPILPFSAHEASASPEWIELDARTHPQLSNAEKLLIRSSSPYELDPRSSGLFGSAKTQERGRLDTIRMVQHSADPETYAENFLRKIGAADQVGKPIPVFLQEYKNLKTGVIAMHPNNPELFLLSTWNVGSIFNENDVLKDSSVGIDSTGEIILSTFENPSDVQPRDVRERLIELYGRLMNNSAVDSRWAYQMEFGLEWGEVWLYQLKPFMKIKQADHSASSGLNVPDYLTSRSSLSFGTLPPEGIELPVVRLPTDYLGKQPGYYVREGADGFGENDIEKAAIEFWRAGEIGRGISGYAETLAALEWGQQMDAQYPDGYCVLLPGLKGNLRIEEYLENAKVVVGINYPLHEVLNHDLTRVITSYPNVMFDVSSQIWNQVVTGDIVKIHSNGIDSIIYNKAEERTEADTPIIE